MNNLEKYAVENLRQKLYEAYGLLSDIKSISPKQNYKAGVEQLATEVDKLMSECQTLATILLDNKWIIKVG